MKLYLDTDLQQLVQSPSVRVPINTIAIKSQDTPAVSIYFVSGGAIQDLGESPVLKFGLVSVAAPTVFLSYDATFTRELDDEDLIRYTGFPLFNTSQMVTALSTSASLACLLEIRYQLADGEIAHALDAAVTVYRTILTEGGTPDPTAIPGYPDVSLIELKSHKDQPSGYAALDSGGKLSPSGIPSTVELVATRDIVSGHAGLDSDGLLDADVIPVDGVTTTVVGGKLFAIGPATGAVSVTTENFTVPAVAANVTISCATRFFTVGAYYIIGGGAGVYQYVSTTDSTHGVFKNVGSGINAAAAAVILFGATIAWSGPPGAGGTGSLAGWYTSAPFTVPAVGATVDIFFGTTFIASSPIVSGELAYLYKPDGTAFYGLFVPTVGMAWDGTHEVLTVRNDAQYAGGKSVAPGDVVPAGTAVMKYPRLWTNHSSVGFPLVSDATLSGTELLPAMKGLKSSDSSISLTNGNLDIDIKGVIESFTSTDITTGNASSSKHGLMPKADGNASHFYCSDGTQKTPAGAGDMVKATYDTVNRGYVDRAVLADTATALVTALQVDTVGSGTDITTNNASSSKHGLLAKGSGTATDFVGGDNACHAHSTVALDTLGACTDITTRNASSSAHGLLVKLSGTATDFVGGDNACHAPSTIALDTLGACTDITTRNASSSAHGLMPKADGNAAHFYCSDGTQKAVTASVPVACVSIVIPLPLSWTAQVNAYCLMLYAPCACTLTGFKGRMGAMTGTVGMYIFVNGSNINSITLSAGTINTIALSTSISIGDVVEVRFGASMPGDAVNFNGTLLYQP